MKQKEPPAVVLEEEEDHPNKLEGIKLLNELYYRPVSDWESLGENVQKNGRKVNSWRKITTMDGEPNTIIQLKMINEFPDCSADKLWEIASNLE